MTHIIFCIKALFFLIPLFFYLNLNNRRISKFRLIGRPAQSSKHLFLRLIKLCFFGRKLSGLFIIAGCLPCFDYLFVHS
ncbi:MAG: hypothetical protein CSB55_05995 [Candidatus Cloacimonadota bacterium]|nr:MAG: hypothetical protein CSB55_05995 [Candidatus Cloacimonadota bacterium]